MTPNRAEKTPPLRYIYTFKSNDGSTKKFEVKLDAQTLRIIRPIKSRPPKWASLKFLPCETCPLDLKEEYCPIAVNIADVVRTFKDVPSTEEVLVTVEGPERTVSKHCPVQSGLHSLLGIYMVASGCPVMEKLRPMIRFHLPFASIPETMYRVLSMYLTAQYFRSVKGMQGDWTLKGLADLYREINEVNIRLSQRISKASQQDATINALVSLDVFTHFLQKPLPDLMDTLEPAFEPYLKSDAKASP